MWLRAAYWSGVFLIVVGLAALGSPAIVESYVGGSAIYGYVEDGRYFVEPGHGLEKHAGVVALLEREAPWMTAPEQVVTASLPERRA